MKAPRTWLAAIVGGALLFALSFALRPLDAPVGAAVVGAPGLVSLAGWLDLLGTLPVVVSALGVGAAALAYARRWWGVARLLGAPVLTEIAARALKLAFARPRPELAIAAAEGFSFPSGHAAFGAALATLLVWFAARYVRGRALVVAMLVLALAWAVAMAGARLVLGVHYLSDVVAGTGLGIACASVVIVATSWAQARRVSDPAR